jgi:hypothetical protein
MTITGERVHRYPVHDRDAIFAPWGGVLVDVVSDLQRVCACVLRV